MILPFYYLITTLEAGGPPDPDAWLKWMLGITVAIIGTLGITLMAMVRNGFQKLETQVSGISKMVYHHDTEIKLLKEGAHSERIAKIIISKFRAMGSGFDADDFN